MKMQTVTKSRRSLLVAGALALFSQGAMSGEANAANGEHEVLVVTAPKPHQEARDSRIENDVNALIEAVNQRIEKDLEQSLEAIGNSRIELAISEVPTRG